MKSFSRLEKLAQLMAETNDSNTIFSFFSDLLTEGEIREMEARLHIVENLAKGKTQRETAKEVACSVAIVSRGAKQLRNSSGGFNRYAEYILKKKDGNLKKSSIKKNNNPTSSKEEGTFELWDLKVEVIHKEGKVWSGQKHGDYFEVKGEHLFLPPGQGFSLYALSSLLPLLPAKQRDLNPNDWMETDTDVRGPDPYCNLLYRIWRTEKRTFQHSQTTQVPLKLNHYDSFT